MNIYFLLIINEEILFNAKEMNCIPNKIENTNKTDLNKKRPGSPPASADFSRTPQDL